MLAWTESGEELLGDMPLSGTGRCIQWLFIFRITVHRVSIDLPHGSDSAISIGWGEKLTDSGIYRQ